MDWRVEGVLMREKETGDVRDQTLATIELLELIYFQGQSRGSRSVAFPG